MRTLAAIAVLLPAVVLGTGGPHAAVDAKTLNKANKLAQKGERALQSGRLDEAREAFEKSVAVLPMYPASNIGLGQLAMQSGTFDEALSRYEKARDGFGELGDDLMKIRTKRYADTQVQIQGLRDSIGQLQDAAAGPNAPPGGYGLQISQMENRIRQLEAVEPPDRESAVEPPGEIFFHIGNALFQLDRAGEAVEAWETCRAKSPNFAMVHHNLALAYWKSGRVEEARLSLAKAEELGFEVNPQFKTDLEAAAARVSPD